MSLSALQVLVHERPVATLSTPDGFSYALTYHPGVNSQDFVSLLMPVRAQSWTWPALHPFFQMNLPEGFLLSVLREQLGPLLGASPLDLLSVVGGNMIGRVKVLPLEDPAGSAPPAVGAIARQAIGLDARVSAQALEGLLHGEHSVERFLALVQAHAASGVSGVVPKFLSPVLAGSFRKASLRTERHILKGSSAHTPFLALNEYLCLKVARQAQAPAAKAEVSEDGQVLKVERFDITPEGTRLGFEDLCSVLGLAPEQKYEGTWERVTRAVLGFIAPAHTQNACEQLALQILLNFALGNADCHTKNLALLYADREDVRVAPIYDLLSIRIYSPYAQNAPGMFLGGRKVWKPARELPGFLQAALGFSPRVQRRLAEQVVGAMALVFRDLLRHARETKGFAPWAARMAQEWHEGVQRLADIHPGTLPDLAAIAQADGLEPRATPALAPRRAGESELLGRRGRRHRAS